MNQPIVHKRLDHAIVFLEVIQMDSHIADNFLRLHALEELNQTRMFQRIATADCQFGIRLERIEEGRVQVGKSAIRIRNTNSAPMISNSILLCPL